MTDAGNQNGGVNLKGEKIDIGNDVVGRDKIVQNITRQTIERRIRSAGKSAQAMLKECEDA